MILTATDSLKYQKKIAKIPELRRFCLTQENNLSMQRIHKQPVIFSCYAAFSPAWSYWNFYGAGCLFEERQDPLTLAYLTPKKQMILYHADQYCYVSPNNLPEENDFFLLWLLCPEFSEFLYFDQNTKSMLDVMFPSLKWEQGIGLTIALLQARNDELADQVKNDFDTMVQQRTVW